MITVVFTETLPVAATALILLPFLFSSFAKSNRRSNGRIWLVAIVTLLAVLGVAVGCGGGAGNGSGGSNPPPATHQVTSSGTITLIVK